MSWSRPRTMSRIPCSNTMRSRKTALATHCENESTE